MAAVNSPAARCSPHSSLGMKGYADSAPLPEACDTHPARPIAQRFGGKHPFAAPRISLNSYFLRGSSAVPLPTALNEAVRHSTPFQLTRCFI
jgi:hypothetical protein